MNDIYTINKVDDGYLIKYKGGASVLVVNSDLTTKELEIIAENSEEFAEIEKRQVDIENIRAFRNKEFLKYDKYQLALMWEDLSDQKKSDYINWRNDWLNATETLRVPKKPNWFE